LANNITGRAKSAVGIRNSDTTILCPIKCKFFIFLLSLHHPNTCFENISNFLFAPLQLNSQKLFLGRKNIGGREGGREGGICPTPLPSPSYAYDDDEHNEKTIMMTATTSVLDKGNTQC
jgi:hypothetical protein